MDGVRQLQRLYWKGSLTLGVVFLGLSMLIGHGLSRLALQPVQLIERTAQRIHVDNLTERIPVPVALGELSGLVILLNRMFDRLEASVAEMRRFTAEASHELKTPLVLARLHAEKLLLGGGLLPVQEESLPDLLEEITRLNKVVENLLFLAKADSGGLRLELTPKDPRTFLVDFFEHGQLLAEQQGLRFTLEANEDGQVAFDANRLRQVLLNLVSNAINVSPVGGLIVLNSTLNRGRWRLTLQDEGPGVPVERLPKIFERFERIGPGGPPADRKGNSLGLALSKSIVTLHSGTIWAENREDRSGVRMCVEIPVDNVSSEINGCAVQKIKEN